MDRTSLELISKVDYKKIDLQTKKEILKKSLHLDQTFLQFEYLEKDEIREFGKHMFSDLEYLTEIYMTLCLNVVYFLDNSIDISQLLIPNQGEEFSVERLISILH